MQPPSIKPSRSQITRQSLVDAAIEIFGRDGFHASSTRTLANAARVNQALIGYHFGGKDGLYLAAIEHIAQRIAQRMGPLAEQIGNRIEALEKAAAGKAPANAEAYLLLLYRVTDAFALMLTDPETTPWARLILREQQDPSPAFDVLYGGVLGRVLVLTTRLAGRIRGIDPQSIEARLLALTIFGQVLVFRAARAAVLRHMQWPAFDGDQINTIQALVRRNVKAILITGERP